MIFVIHQPVALLSENMCIHFSIEPVPSNMYTLRSKNKQRENSISIIFIEFVFNCTVNGVAKRKYCSKYSEFFLLLYLLVLFFE